jgi:hypothetical protein
MAHNSNLGKFTIKVPISSIGQLGMRENAIREEIFLCITIRGVGALNVVRIQGRTSNDDNWVTVQDITGPVELLLVNVAFFDFIRFSAITLDVTSSSILIGTSYTDLKLPVLYGIDAFGDPALNVAGALSPSGLNIGGKVTQVTLNALTWTPLPATPLAFRNALAIQNYSGIEVKINYLSSVVGYVGVIIGSGAERSYDVGSTIVLYGKSASGTPTIIVEELA